MVRSSRCLRLNRESRQNRERSRRCDSGPYMSEGSVSQAILVGKVTVPANEGWEGEPENRKSQKTCLEMGPRDLRIKETGCNP